MKKLCEDCKMRSAYDKNHDSLIGKFWRWHINFCPGWKAYYKTLNQEQKSEIKNKYKFTKYN